MRVYKKQIERIVITGDMAERNKAINYAYNKKYKVVRSGPKHTIGFKVDVTRFKLVAERQAP